MKGSGEERPVLNDAYSNPDIEGILPKGPYLPCVSMAGRALLAGYPRYYDYQKANELHLITGSLASIQFMVKSLPDI